MPRIKAGLVVLAALVLFALVYAHVGGLNGPAYWKWQYRLPPLAGVKVYLPMLLAILPALAAFWINRQRRIACAGAVLLLMVASMGMRLASVIFRTEPPSLDVVEAVVQQPHMTSYYTDATSVKDRPLRQWVREYPRLMQRFHLHTQSKPPGPMIYWWGMIQLFGESSAPRIGGVILGILATLGISATYLLLRLMLADEPAAFAGAAFLSACPGFVLFFPMMDPAYTVLSCGMIGLWFVALRDDRTSLAAALGVWLGVALIVSFSLLVLGAFILMLIALVPAQRSAADRVRIAAKQAGIAAGTMMMTILLLWIVVGYNPGATFLSAWHHQHELLLRYADQRPYPWTILFDLTDFALGVGWIGVLVAVFALSPPPGQRGLAGLVGAVFAQFLIVAGTGLLQSETSRVWNFMLPLLMIPVGLELSRWPMAGRIAALAALSLLTAAIHQNMTFLY